MKLVPKRKLVSGLEETSTIVQQVTQPTDGETIQPSTVTTMSLKNLAVTTAKITDLAVVTAKIGDLAVTNAKINDLAVDKLTAGTITSQSITLAVTGGSGDVKIQSGKTDFTNTETGFILGMDDSDSDRPKFYIGSSSYYLNWTGTSLVVNGATISSPVITGIATGSEIAIQGWQQNMTFSATDYNTVAWTLGTITLTNGVTYSIVAGTVDMTALNYIYLDIGTSTTVLQKTTTAANAVGSGKILIAVAQNNSDTTSKATFQVFGGSGGQLIAVDNIAANSASVNEFISNTAQIKDAIITTAKINDLAVGKLTAGTITANVTIANTFKTAASPNPRIEIDASYIAGYSDATTKQFYLSSADGKAYFGAGACVISSGGMNIEGTAKPISFTVSGVERGKLYASTTWFLIDSANVAFANADYVIFESGCVLYPTLTNTGVIGTSTKVWNNGIFTNLTLSETTTPDAVADFGKVYTKNDNKFYFQDGAGSEHAMLYGISDFLDNTAGGTNAEVTKAPTSNVMYDHGVATTGIHGVGAGTIAKVADIVATKLDDFTAPDNNTDLNASATAHGLLPILSNVATEYLSGTGAFSVPATANVKVKAGTRDMTAASGNVAYTGYDFTPTGLIIVFYNSYTGEVSIGVSDPAKLKYCLFLNAGAQGSNNTTIIDSTSADKQSAIVATYDADGFTLTWTKAGSPTGTGNLTVFAFK